MEAGEPSPSPDDRLACIRRYQETLVHFGGMAPQAIDLDQLLQLAAVEAARATGVGRAKVMRYRAEQGDLLVVAGVGWRPGVVGETRLGTDVASLPGRALQSRAPVVVERVPGDPEFRYPKILRDHGIVSVLNVPVEVDGQVWGVLEVDSDATRRFEDDDVGFLLAMARVLGLAIHAREAVAEAVRVKAEAAFAQAGHETVLRELMHRNKNDFQLVVSMLMLQKRKHADAAVRRSFDHVVDRVAAISLAHDQLSTSEAIGTIEVGAYLQALCGNLDQRSERVRVVPELDRAELPHQRAVVVGLIVNELVTNALKHAFPGEREGAVRVGFLAGPDGMGEISVTDDGVGMGPPRPGGSGTDLVEALAHQIGGRLERETSDRGTAIRVPFVVAR